MAENLKRCKLFPDIPPELWYLVAGHLVRQCAVVTLQGQFPADAKASTSEIDLSGPIYASYVKVDGNIYVRSLYNSPVGTSSSDTRLFFPTKEDSKTAGVEVWVSEDHQGIRRIVFLAPGALQIWCNEQRPVPGVWWRKVPLADVRSTVKIQIDVRMAEILPLLQSALAIGMEVDLLPTYRDSRFAT